jgi:hypothetical protein
MRLKLKERLDQAEESLAQDPLNSKLIDPQPTRFPHKNDCFSLSPARPPKLRPSKSNSRSMSASDNKLNPTFRPSGLQILAQCRRLDSLGVRGPGHSAGEQGTQPSTGAIFRTDCSIGSCLDATCGWRGAWGWRVLRFMQESRVGVQV